MNRTTAGLAVAATGALGVHLLWTALAMGWSGLAPGHGPARRHRRPRLTDWLRQAGVDGVRPVEFVAVVASIATAGAGIGYALFSSPLPALAAAAFAATTPVAAFRTRRWARRTAAHEAWPALIEEMRVATAALGRSVPQALFEVGLRGPDELRPAFEQARREWMVSTDFERTVAVLESSLADPTADAACETLLVAHQLGGSGLDRRLEALADDRRADVQYRRDALARLAGARFARKFVLLVPLGMAAMGLTIGDGKEAFRTPAGQVAAVAAIGVVAACWAWAGALLRLPDERRVFGR